MIYVCVVWFLFRAATDHNEDNSAEILRKWAEAVRSDYHSVNLTVGKDGGECIASILFAKDSCLIKPRPVGKSVHYSITCKSGHVLIYI